MGGRSLAREPWIHGAQRLSRRQAAIIYLLANEAAARVTALESERDALLAAAGKEAVPIGYVQASALPLLKRGAADTIFGDCHECADVPLYAAPTAALEKGDGRDAWQPIESAPEGKLLVVSWLDKDDPENPERHAFDFIEDGGWVRHNEDYDHFLCVAPPGSRGPSADSPYTHWMALPDVPSALSQKAGEQE
jgi:hypothetical protein